MVQTVLGATAAGTGVGRGLADGPANAGAALVPSTASTIDPATAIRTHRIRIVLQRPTRSRGSVELPHSIFSDATPPATSNGRSRAASDWGTRTHSSVPES